MARSSKVTGRDGAGVARPRGWAAWTGRDTRWLAHPQASQAFSPPVKPVGRTWCQCGGRGWGAPAAGQDATCRVRISRWVLYQSSEYPLPLSCHQQKAASFFYKGPANKYFRLPRPGGFSCNSSALPLQRESSHRLRTAESRPPAPPICSRCPASLSPHPRHPHPLPSRPPLPECCAKGRWGGGQ